MSEAITKDMIINDIINKYPETLPVFNQYHVDSCCGGGYSVEKTATQDGVDVDAFVAALNKAISK